MQRMKKRFPFGQRGVALIEFALALPVLMFLLIGLIEIGRLAYFGIELGNAAHAGAQYGAIPGKAGDFTGMQTIATNDGQNTIDPAMTATASNVCTCWTGTSQSPSPPTASACGSPCTNGGRKQTYVQVSVTGTARALFNYRDLGLPSSWTVTRVATIQAAQ